VQQVVVGVAVVVLLAMAWALLVGATWVGGSASHADMSGWDQLARAYPGAPGAVGTVLRYRSLRLRPGCQGYAWLTLTANTEGLSIVAPALYHGHPPIFLPWRDMVVQRGRRLGFFEEVYLLCAPEPSVPVRLHPTLAREIRAAIGPAWPGESDSRDAPRSIA
jgi:hypothetical protein